MLKWRAHVQNGPRVLDAYDLYLRAVAEMHSNTEAGFRNAEHLLREALQGDPNSLRHVRACGLHLADGERGMG